MTQLAVTDAHPLIWYATGRQRKLGRAALRLFERADAGRSAIYVPTLALVEVAEQVRAGRVSLGSSFRDWESALFASGHYLPAELTREVVRASEELAAIPERGDRLIAATAAVLDCPLITRDPAIARAAAVDLVW